MPAVLIYARVVKCFLHRTSKDSFGQDWFQLWPKQWLRIHFQTFKASTSWGWSQGAGVSWNARAVLVEQVLVCNCWSSPFLFGSTPVFVWCMKLLWQRPIVQPLTSYHLFPALLSQLLLPSHLYLTNGNVVLRSDFWTFDRLKDLLIKSFFNQCCEISQFRGQRNFWPHCRVMIRRFIAVEFCNKRLQCVVFYESHLAIIK